MMRRSRILSRALTLVALLALAPRTEALELPDGFETGDSVVFIGDSITMQHLFTQYIELYFYTRYPESGLRFFNAGVFGDRATSVLDRWDGDIERFEPDVAFVLLGMNDGRYRPFDHEFFHVYATDMREIVFRLEERHDARIILLGPTHYDYPTLPELKKRRTERQQYNDALIEYGNFCRALATEKELPFRDLNTPMREVIERERASNPDFALTLDGVHPTPVGHALVAGEVLQAIEAPSLVSEVTVDARTGLPMVASNAGVSDIVTAKKKGVSFTVKAGALPFPWLEAFREAERFATPRERLSREILRVTGLEKGVYELRIDDRAVGQYASDALTTGVDLAKNRETPQMRQAFEVADLTRRRDEFCAANLRLMWFYRKLAARAEIPHRFGILRDRDRDEQYGEVEKKRRAELEAEYEKNLDSMVAMEKDIYETARPRPRRYTLQRLSGPPAGAN